MSVTADTRLPAPPPTGPLRPSLPVWGLFGRCLLIVVGDVLIVPFPWTAVYLYKFMCDHVALPDGRRLKFTGRGGDIWYVFMAIPAALWAAQIVGLATMGPKPSDNMGLANVLGLAAALLGWVLTILIFRWVCTHVKTDDDKLSLTFEGSILAYIGWNILFILSVLTIIGWAWVLKFMMRWLCRNVQGTLAFDFTGTGLSILWRSVVTYLVCILIIPIPWMFRWYMNWFISQVSVIPPAANP